MRRREKGRRLLGAALLFFCAAAPAAARIQLPSPGDRSVHDFASVLSPEVIGILEERHRELFRKTGVALVVVTVGRLEGEPIGDFAVRVGKEWGVGKKGEDRGIVVAVATEDRRIFVATGYGVEGFLPDGRVGGILDRYVIPPLRRRDFSGGIEQASAALCAAAAAEYGVTLEGVGKAPAEFAERGRGGKGGFLHVILSLLFAGFFFYVILRHPSLLWLLLLSGRGGRWQGRSGGFRGEGSEAAAGSGDSGAGDSGEAAPGGASRTAPGEVKR